eukprot:4714195-Alexandrium_andersonii.AAC.1
MSLPGETSPRACHLPRSRSIRSLVLRPGLQAACTPPLMELGSLRAPKHQLGPAALGASRSL